MTLESEEVRIKIMLRVIKFIDRFIEVFKLKTWSRGDLLVSKKTMFLMRRDQSPRRCLCWRVFKLKT